MAADVLRLNICSFSTFVFIFNFLFVIKLCATITATNGNTRNVIHNFILVVCIYIISSVYPFLKNLLLYSNNLMFQSFFQFQLCFFVSAVVREIRHIANTQNVMCHFKERHYSQLHCPKHPNFHAHVLRTFLIVEHLKPFQLSLEKIQAF